MKIPLNKTLIVVAIIFSLTLIQGALAQSIFDIEFPIPELGNCKDKQTCKVYCDDENNKEACRSFAAKYGIGGKQKDNESADEEEVLAALAQGGPGNCAVGKSAKGREAACHQYCSKKENIRACVLFGKEHGLLKGKKLEEAQKVLQAIENGVELPKQCKDAESCEATCKKPKDVETARSCFAFAEKAGILPADVNKEKAEKMFQLMEEGKGPFKSFEDFGKCENPENEEILNQCIQFGTEHGFIPPEEAEIIRKTGGKGPGSCIGREQCDRYCRENEDECMAFAERHDLFPPEERARMRESAERIKSELQRAPEDVRACIEKVLGEQKYKEIMDGIRPPNRAASERMSTCFEAFHSRNNEARDGGDDRRGPPEEFPGQGEFRGEAEFRTGPEQSTAQKRPGFPESVRACAIEKYGEEFMVQIEKNNGRMTREMETKMRTCFNEALGEQKPNDFTGPGGCKGEACRRYCEDPEHQQECASFEHNGNPGVSNEERRRFEEERRQIYNERLQSEQNKYSDPQFRSQSIPQDDGALPTDGRYIPPNDGYTPPKGDFDIPPIERSYPSDQSQGSYEIYRTPDDYQQGQLQTEEYLQQRENYGEIPQGSFVPPEGFNPTPTGEAPVSRGNRNILERAISSTALVISEFAKLLFGK